jgi:hypothetical protein
VPRCKRKGVTLDIKAGWSVRSPDEAVTTAAAASARQPTPACLRTHAATLPCPALPCPVLRTRSGRSGRAYPLTLAVPRPGARLQDLVSDLWADQALEPADAGHGGEGAGVGHGGGSRSALGATLDYEVSECEREGQRMHASKGRGSRTVLGRSNINSNRARLGVGGPVDAVRV